MSKEYSIKDLKFLWVEWLQSLGWDKMVKELTIHRTWRKNCECFVCWLEKKSKKEEKIEDYKIDIIKK